MPRRVLGGLAAVTIAGALVLTAAGCSSNSATTPAPVSPATTTAAPIAAEHNPADVSFAQGMTPHHAQAIVMATQASSRASSAQVKDLASRIETAQGPEIDQLDNMLAAWGAPTTSPSATAMPGMSPGSGLPGMMDESQMTQLASLNGPAFDQVFLLMMVQHHTGAIMMSRTELAQGLNPQAKALANSIIADQQREITEMQAILNQR